MMGTGARLERMCMSEFDPNEVRWSEAVARRACWLPIDESQAIREAVAGAPSDYGHLHVGLWCVTFEAVPPGVRTVEHLERECRPGTSLPLPEAELEVDEEPPTELEVLPAPKE